MTINLEALDRDAKLELFKSLKEIDERLKYNKAKSYFPETGPCSRHAMKKHVDFMNASANHLQRCFIGGNRSGKTETMAFEVYLHATGNYDDHPWYTGKKFNPAEDITIVVASDSHENTRINHQEKLLGKMHDIGTGLIPKHLIMEMSGKAGITGAVGEVKIRRKGGGVSTILLKSYIQGREAFQGFYAHFIGLDEECPKDVYEECLMRTATTRGRIGLYFTPLNGLTSTVLQFLPGGRVPENNIVEATNAYVSAVKWSDVPLEIAPQDFRDEMKKTLSYDAFLARSEGQPWVGSGKVYNTPENIVTIEPFKIPTWWSRWYAFDIGYNCSAAVFFAYDKQTDIIYVYDEYYSARELPSTHVAAIRGKGGNWMQGLIDPSALQTNKHDGQSSYKLYRNLGLDIRLADNRVETGINEVTNRLSTGRLKFFNTCKNLINEYRLYRYTTNETTMETKVAKGQEDHAMDALRYGVMNLKVGRVYEEEIENKDSKYNYRLQNLINSRNPTTGY